MELIDELKKLSQSSFHLCNNVIRLALIELRLAEQSIPIVAGLILLGIILAASAWVGLLALLITYLVSIGIRAEWSLLCAIILHVLAILWIVIAIYKYRNNFTFPATRRQLNHVSKKNF